MRETEKEDEGEIFLQEAEAHVATRGGVESTPFEKVLLYPNEVAVDWLGVCFALQV